MGKEEALKVLIANACCACASMCGKCPWNGTEDCANTFFPDVLEQAIGVMLEDK